MNRIEWLMVAVCLTSFGAGLGVGMAVPAAASVLQGREGEEATEGARFAFEIRKGETTRLDVTR